MSPDPNVVLVTDGEQRAALAIVRSLGASGFKVVVSSTRARSLAGTSRFAAATVRVRSALDDPGAFLDDVERIVRDHSVGLMMPVTDDSLLAVLEARQRFPGLIIPFASVDQYRRISDKAALLEVAAGLGIGVPEQRTIAHPGAARDIDFSALRFPIVLKPSRSVIDVNGGGGGTRQKTGVSHAADPSELSARLGEYPEQAFPILLQQRIVGPGIGVFLLVWDGATVAAFGHRRIREHPPSGGVSVYREAIVPDRALVAQSRALLDCFAWQGVAMIEYKLDARSGVPYLMEVNGRFWGSLQLAIDAGVDFPTLLARVSRGDTVQPGAGRAGIRSRWEWGDANHLLARVRKSRTQLALPPDAPSLGRTVLDMCKVRRGDRLEVLRLSDPAPFLREAIDWFRRL